MLKIALDAMGGDRAPHEIVAGAYLALQEFPIHIVLVGIESVVQSEMARFKDWPENRVSVVHASQTVEMGESPSVSFRTKKESSIQVGLNLVKSGEAGAFVSAGNTGAVMTAATFILGRVDGVLRPAIASVMPSRDMPFVMLDMGSNVDSKPEHLVQFAIMGKLFAQAVLKIENPRVGLLNIGEEKDKGNALTQATYPLLEEEPTINFVGNVEGKHILKGDVDVAVCDGFVGNSVLKFGEGVSSLFMNFFKEEAKKSLISLFALLLLGPSLRKFKKKFDYQEVGGAPLLGVNGVTVIAHGKSKAKAIKNAIKIAMHEADNKVVAKIGGAVK